MQNFFKVGYNFDIDLPKKFDELNQKYDNKIEEVFGSISIHDWMAARPTFRLPTMSGEDFRKHVKELLKYNITFNYTLNAPFIGSLSYINTNLSHIHNALDFLESAEVKRITISIPLLGEIIREHSKDAFELELSTIAELNSVTQIKALKESIGINRVCMSLSKNRDFGFLEACQKAAESLDVKLNLMVNEFCIGGGVDYSTNCIWRQSCYNFHSVNKTKEECELFHRYPMGRCIMGRKSDPYNWLRARFILPQWLKYYNKIGINHFKITGRTGGSIYLHKVIEAYMKERWVGNLLELWKQLESIYDGKKDSDNDYISDCILSSKLDKFIDHWTDNPQFDCNKELCGTTCKYCKEFYEKMVEEDQRILDKWTPVLDKNSPENDISKAIVIESQEKEYDKTNLH